MAANSTRPREVTFSQYSQMVVIPNEDASKKWHSKKELDAMRVSRKIKDALADDILSKQRDEFLIGVERRYIDVAYGTKASKTAALLCEDFEKLSNVSKTNQIVQDDINIPHMIGRR